MNKIYYNENVDFVHYIHTVANVTEIREKNKNENGTTPKSRNKAFEKKEAEFLNEAEMYYKELSFIQKNYLDLFFHRSMVTTEYLLSIEYQDLNFEEQTAIDFKKFIQTSMEMDDFKADYDYIYSHVEDYYGSPNSFEDFDKTTNLILDIIKDPSTFDESFKQAVRSLKQLFVHKKIEPIREKIDEKIEKHTNILQKDPHNFIKNLTSGKIVNSEFEADEMKHYILFYSPTTIMISIRHKKVYYGIELENLAPKEKDEDFHLALFKFLSDSKRYKMIQMLSKKKWYANELAKAFNITPATMSYHINKLYGLGIIHVEQGEQNKLYLELDKERLTYLLSQIKDDLIK